MIAVTDAGREMVREAQEIVARVHADVLSALPEDERGPFMDALAQARRRAADDAGRVRAAGAPPRAARPRIGPNKIVPYGMI